MEGGGTTRGKGVPSSDRRTDQSPRQELESERRREVQQQQRRQQQKEEDATDMQSCASFLAHETEREKEKERQVVCDGSRPEQNL